ncbi:tetratricopeptide repeat protein [Streptomyces sp. NPDC047525]|uniref:tetratricopeptide repeat protein n=1 Tax=Streptomyces sp. NPDC047525 TaxID=3155264 RepID=UPI0033E592D0
MAGSPRGPYTAGSAPGLSGPAAAGPPAREWPHLVGVLPQEAHCFQGRAVGGLLAREMAAGGTAVLGQVLAGTGGVGKTQLAARYARDLRDSGEIDLLLWVTAVNREAVVTAYAQAAEEWLGLARADSEQAAARFLAWLEPRPAGGPSWLIVLDDLADPVDLLADPALHRGGLWPPASPRGRTLITTRRRDAVLTGHGRRSIEVGLFAREESVNYLTRVLDAGHEGAGGGAGAGCGDAGRGGAGIGSVGHGGAGWGAVGRGDVGIGSVGRGDVGWDDAGQGSVRYGDAGQSGAGRDGLGCAGARQGFGCPGRHDPGGCVARLAGDLGDLPLALSQAAAYLLEARDVSCAEYRRQLRVRSRELERLFPERGMLPDTQTATITATWSLSVERADAMRPRGLARPMLALIALLDPNGIPAAVLTSPPALAHLAAHRTPHTPDPVTAEDAVGALRALHRLSLIDHTPGVPHQAVRVHQLIQRTFRESLPHGALEEAAVVAADALVAAWPDVERDTALAQVLRANADAVRRVAEPALWRSGIHPVLLLAGDSVQEGGQVTAALVYFGTLGRLAHDRLGPDHRQTLRIRLQLADLRGMAGYPDEALTGLQEALVDCERVLGPYDRDTLRARHELAHAHGLVGNVAGALASLEQILVVRQWVLGDDHPETLDTRGSLALWWGDAGDTAGAIAALEQLIVDRERVLGRDHPDLFRARHNLALYRGEEGDKRGAVAAYRQLLADRVRVLGPDHAETLGTRRELAYWQRVSGDVTTALVTFELLVSDMDRVLGADHLDTLTTRRSLGYTWGVAGDTAGSVIAYRQVLADLRRVLGPDHAETLATAAVLVGGLVDRGRQHLSGGSPQFRYANRNLAGPSVWHAQALACFEEARALADPEESPGVHGGILQDIADTYRGAGQLEEAVDHYQQAIAYRRRADQPGELVVTMNALANCLVVMGELAEAAAVLRQITGELLRFPESAGRATYLHNVGLTYEELGGKGVEGAYAEAVTVYQAVLALVDPETDPGSYAAALKDMGDALAAQGQLEQSHVAYSHRWGTPAEDHPQPGPDPVSDPDPAPDPDSASGTHDSS